MTTLLTPRRPRRAPGTMLGLAAQENRRGQKKVRPLRERTTKIVRLTLAVVALAIGLSGFSMSSAQAWPWDDMKDNITATIFNMCGPNDVPDQATYTNIDTMAGLNREAPRDGYRSTIKPNFKKDESGGQGGNGMERLQRVYGDKGDVIAKPTYERYGFSTLTWNNYGYDCFSSTLMMGPLADMGLISMVHVPMMIAMAFLNFVMNDALYTVFASMMQPFIGAMYEIFNPWIYLIVPIGIGITWLTSKGSLQATLKSTGWGVMILSVYLLMGSSTSKVVSWATNIVTEVSGSAACKMNAAANGGNADNGECDTDEPIKAVQQALWYGIPYQTWHLGQVGEQQAALDAEAEEKGQVGWGPALLNGQYVGVDEDGKVDESGKDVIRASNAWNQATYSPEGEDSKNEKWGKGNSWDKIPYLANVKIMCDDRDTGDSDPGADDNAQRRWMYSGAVGTSSCDSAGAGTEAMVPYVQGDEYNKQMLVAMSGMVGVGAVALTIVVSGVYLGFQKMMFFFLLFLAPVVLLVSAFGDRKRRPFAIRYAEIIGANLLKQIAAVCIVLFVSYSMASLFGSTTFGAIPWIMKPYAALLFFVALAFLAFPLKSMIQGAIKGDTSVIDKQATAPQRAAKNTAKVAAVGTAALATGGIGLAAVGGVSGIAPAVAAAGGKGAMMGKVGSGLGQAGRVMGIGSKSGRAMRAGGQLFKVSQGVMEGRDNIKGRKLGMFNAAAKMIRENPSRYKQLNEDGSYGGLLPGAQEQAMKDSQKIAERGQGFLRAGQTRDKFMKDWAAGWDGPDPKRPPQDDMPDPRPRPRPEPQSLPPGGATPQLAPGSSGTNSGGANGSGDVPSPEPRPDGDPQPIAPSGGVTDAAPESVHSGGATAPQPQRRVKSNEEYAEDARENLGGPAFAKEMDYNVNTVRSGDDVLTRAVLSKDDVIKDPTVLLSGSAYNGGNTTTMDPFHGATPAMNELRFASGSGDEDAIQDAVSKAVDAISQHGVPNQVDGVHSIGARAEKFDAVQLVGAMPHLTESMSWQERAEAAHTMMAAQVAIPQDAPDSIRDEIREFTAQLARPSADLADLASRQEDVIADLSWWKNQVADDVYTAAPDPASTTSSVPALQPESPRHTEHSAPEQVVDDDPVDVVDDSEALVYRPGRDRRKKKRSGLFDHDNDQSDDEEES